MLWNGPPKLRLIGVVSVLEPEGVIVRLSDRLPLLTVWAPLKVCLSSAEALSLELLPHAATTQRADRRDHQRTSGALAPPPIIH